MYVYVLHLYNVNSGVRQFSVRTGMCMCIYMHMYVHVHVYFQGVYNTCYLNVFKIALEFET